MVDYQNTAQGLATLGRGGDSTLVHMNPSEVAGLQNLAVRNGTSLTTNPNTGMPEAFNLRGLIPMAVGAGLTAATGGAAAGGISPLMAGLMVGGATALMQGDIMAGLGAGLGAYGGGSLAEGFSAAAEAVPAGTTTGEVVQDQIQQNISNMNPTIPGPQGPNMTSFSGGAGGGTMGIPNAGNAVSGNYPTAFQNTTNPNSNILGQGNIPQANLNTSNASGYQYTPNEIAGRAGTANNPIYNDATGIISKVGTSPTITNAANSTMPSYMNQTGAQQAANNAGITDALSIRDINAVSANNSGLGSISVDSVSDNLSRTGEGFKNVFTDYSATRDAMGLTDGEMAMKFGMPMAAGLAGGLEESDFQEKGVDMTEFEDNRFRGPEGQLNLSGQTGLNLNNPYGYAKGGAVEQGMEAAIARNSGGSYTPPASVSTPISTPVASSNINVGGFSSAPSNLTGGLGALNVGTGTVGQSPNAVAEAARLKAIEDAKPKYTTPSSGVNVGGAGGQGSFSVPSELVMGQGYMPTGAIMAGPAANYYRDIAGNYIRRAEGGPIPAAYAEGGAVEQGMEAAIARNIGRTYTPPASVSAPVSAPVYAPVSAPVAPSNINVGGFTSAPSNLTGGVGALNVGTGTIGKSPDKALRDTHFKMLRGYEVPIDYTPGSPGGQGNIYSGYTQPTQASHTYNKSTNKWEKSKPVHQPFRIGGNNGMGIQYMVQQAFSGYGGPDVGVAQFAEGGYLGGGDINVQGDGMSDDIPANIDNEQPAALSEGEFVIPADVVSHIGNGSSEAGAKEFYGMMDRVRMARTGRKKQSPEIDPERFMPA